MYYQWREEDQQQQQQAPQNQLQVQLNIRPEEPEWLDQQPQYVREKARPKIKNNKSAQKQNDLLFQMQNQLQKSKKPLKKNIMNRIYTKIHEMQYNVFVGQTTDNKLQYLDKLYQHNTPNRYIKQVTPQLIQQINETVMQTNLQIQKGIYKNEIKLKEKRIPQSKHQLQDLQNQDHYRLLKIKQGQMKNKIGHFKKQLQTQTIKAKLKRRVQNIDEQQFQRKYYSIDHPKTLQASYFIKEVQDKSKEVQRQVYQSKVMEMQRKRQIQQQQKYEKQMQMQERKTKLQEYYQSKLMNKLQQKERDKQKRLEYQEWIKQYQREKPLQLQREEEYRMKVIIPQLQEQHKKLMTIKAQHRPIDMEEIIDHEEKYLQFKKDNSIRKRAEIELKKEEENMNKDDIDSKLYKGKYRFLVLEQMIQQKYPIQYKQIQQSKKDRIKAYNQHLRSIHHDIYEQNNERHKIESQTNNHQKFIRRVRKMNGSMNITSNKDQRDQQVLQSERGERKVVVQDTYQQGIKNLNFIKSKVRQQKAQQVEKPSIINLVEENQYEKPKGFLQGKRQVKHKEKNKEIVTSVSKDIQKTSIVTNDEIGHMNAKMKFLDERLRRKEQMLKNDDKTKMKDGQKIQGDYVNAIKAKIHMLQQFK